MAELIAFRGKISSGVKTARDVRAQALDNLNSRSPDGIDLVRIVRHQSERTDAEEPANRDRERIIAQVDRMSQAEIRFDGVEPLVLKLIRAHLLHQPDAPAFLLLIEQQPNSFFGDCGQGQVKLVVTIAPQRMKNLSCRALRMNAGYGRGAVDIP